MKRHVTFAILACIGIPCLPVGARAQDARGLTTSSQSPAELAAWIDLLFANLWEEEGTKPSPIVDDATFLRRVYLDLIGTIPSVSQTRDFLADASVDKRRKLVERLLEDRRYADHMGRIWRRVLIPSDSPGAGMATQLEPWLKEQFLKNLPYDDSVRRLLTATGNVSSGTPLAFYVAVGNKPENLASAVSRVFLGVRIGCAQCHDHPFASWKQQDFWAMAAFFAGTNPSGQRNLVVADRRVATIRPPNSDKEYPARFLWGDIAKIPKDKSPREVLAGWTTSAENPNFGATAVNRVWQHLFGRGLVDPVDDLDLAPGEERAVVLDRLARRFADAGFDMRWLIQGLCQSKVYQRVSETGGAEDLGLFSHRPLKTLTPEQVFDALEQALSLPVSKNESSPRYNGQRQQLIARLNEAFSDSPEEYLAGISQVLMMMNGKLVGSGTSLEESRTLRGVADAPFLNPSEKIETLYLAALTRPPRQNELKTLLPYVQEQRSEASRQQGYADIFWALLNSPEFVLSR